MGKGTIYDVSRYEEEIKYLASRYRVKPSFSGKTIDVKINEETSIEDANKVLNDYEVINNNNAKRVTIIKCTLFIQGMDKIF